MKSLILIIAMAVVCLQTAGQVSINTDGSTPDPSAGLDVKFTNKGFLPPRLTYVQMNGITGPTPGLLVYCTDCGADHSGALAVFMNGNWNLVNVACLSPAAPEPGVHLSAPTQITWYWNSVPWATGYKWNTSDDYNTATDMGMNIFKTETGLTCHTSYNRYLWAYNACGISPVTILTQSTSVCPVICDPFTVGHVAGPVAPVDKTVTYGTVINIPGTPGKCWITRNLGASQQASAVDDNTEASAGWYWQFNRKQGYKHDGVTLTPAWTITGISESLDWLSENDPCRIELGISWRIPTYTEWNNVDNADGWTNRNGPWNSGLKIHAAGYLYFSDGSKTNRGFSGQVWSSSRGSSTTGWHLYFEYGSCYMGANQKATGMPLRCMRDEL